MNEYQVLLTKSELEEIAENELYLAAYQLEKAKEIIQELTSLQRGKNALRAVEDGLYQVRAAQKKLREWEPPDPLTGATYAISPEDNE